MVRGFPRCARGSYSLDMFMYSTTHRASVSASLRVARSVRHASSARSAAVARRDGRIDLVRRTARRGSTCWAPRRDPTQFATADFPARPRRVKSRNSMDLPAS